MVGLLNALRDRTPPCRHPPKQVPLLMQGQPTLQAGTAAAAVGALRGGAVSCGRAPLLPQRVSMESSRRRVIYNGSGGPAAPMMLSVKPLNTTASMPDAPNTSSDR